MYHMSGMLNQRRLGRLGRHGEDCYTCVQQCDTAAVTEVEDATEVESAADDKWERFEFPVQDPYGADVHVDDLVKLRAEEPGSSSSEIIGETNHDTERLRKYSAAKSAIEQVVEETGAMPDDDDAQALFTGASGARRNKRGSSLLNPYLSTPEVNAMTLPVLKQMVANVQEPLNANVDDSPSVLNGHLTYADEARFAAEQQKFFLESPLIVGLSKDLAENNDYKRIQIMGKSILITRDGEGVFRAFENACRHRGMELVSAEAPSGNKRLHVCPYHAWAYGSDGSLMSVPFEEGFTDENGAHATERGGLIALPAAERAGLLFVVPTVVAEEEFEEMLAQTLPPALEAELSAYNLGEHHRVVSQTVTVDANWKLGVDTFCETYHFTKLHPGLREDLVANTSVFRTFEPEQGLKSSSCMTLGRSSTRFMAAGLPEEQWAEPSTLSHLAMVYHLAPNTVLIVSGGQPQLSQHWPGATVDSSTIALSILAPVLPDSAEDMQQQRQGFGGFLDLIAGEDFQLLSRMQQNFAANADIEVVVGRHEPCLADRHRYYAAAVEGRY